VVANSIVGVDDELALGAAGEVEAPRRDVVEPLVVSAKGDVFLEVVFDGRVVDRVSKLVDFFDFDCAWCHVVGRVWAGGRE
jgi:hypothetical protein